MPLSDADPYFTPDPSPSRRSIDPSDRVRQIASRANISPDIAEDYLKTTQVESGHNVNVRPSSKGALGFGQVMPDVKGGSIRTVGGRRYNLKTPDENIEAGLKYFAEGGSDPTSRRLYYFGGPKAKAHYENTGQIPNISDGNMTAAQYVRATGGELPNAPVRRFQQNTQPPASDPYFTPNTPQRPASAEPTTSWRRFGTGKQKRTRPKGPFAGVQAGVEGSQGVSMGEDATKGQPSDTDRVRQAVSASAPPGFGLLPKAAQEAIGEQVAKGASKLMEYGAGAMKILPHDPLTGTKEARQQLIAGSQSAARGAQQMERQANRPTVHVPVLGDVGMQDVYNVGGGMISSAPSLVLMRLGVPAPIAFGLQSYLESTGRDADFKDVLKETGVGAATGGLFEIPLPARMALLAKIGAKLGIVGGGTYGIEKLTGMPEAEARKNAAVNALFAASGVKSERPEIKVPPQTVPDALQGKLRGGEINTVLQAREAAVKPPTQASEVPAMRVAGRLRGAEPIELPSTTYPETKYPESLGVVGPTKPIEGVEEGAKLNRWQHRDFGLVTESVDQSGAGKGRVRVLAEDGTEHVIQRPTGTGAGNQIAVPVRKSVDTRAQDEAAQAQENAPFKVTDRRRRDEQSTPREPLAPKEPEFQKGQRLPSDFVYHNTRAESLPEIERSGFDQGSFSDKPIDFGGDTWIAVRKSRLPQSQEYDPETQTFQIRIPEHQYGGARAYEPSFEKGAVPAEEFYVVNKRGQVIRRLSSASAPNEAVAKAAMDEQFRAAPPPIETKLTEPLADLYFTPSPATTSARKSQMTTDRAELDLPELPQAERKSWQTSLANAKPERAGLLADEVLNKPRSLNDEETASLVVRAQKIKNEHAQTMKEISASSDPETIQARKAQADALEREFDKITRATKASGTEKGRTLAAQKLTINQDYDLVSLVQRAKAAKGRELTSDERSRYEKMASQIEDLSKQLVDADEKAQTAQLQRRIGKIQRQTRRQQTRSVLDDEFASLKASLAQAKLETRSGVQGSLLAGLDPEGKLTPIIARMAKNRVKAGINSAEALIDEVFSAVKDHYDVSRDDIAKIVRGTLHQPDDVLSKWDKRRQSQLLKQQGDIETRLTTGDFSPRRSREAPIYSRETFRLQKQINELKAKYDREMYRATRGITGKLIDTAAGFGNIPKTMLSMADVSAVLRQGGIGVYQHPILSGKAGVDMLKAFTSHGFANVENAIKNSPRFNQAKKSGVEFTGIDKDNPQLSKHEEGYLGSGAIDTLAKGTLNPLRVVKGVKDFSERTFVSFLDSQRMRIFENQATALEGMGLKGRELDDALKSQAKYINIITGRGSLGAKGNQAAPALNVALFSPRLIASRVQFLNKMFNPVSWTNTPKGARKLQMIDNAKFLFGVASTLALAKAAGANVSLDPDDSEFLKIKVGNTRYDTLAGLQQPMRFMYRMARAVKGGETYEGEDKGKILADFARSKAAPLAGYATDYFEGRNRLSGKKFEAGKDLVRNVIPLPFQDFQDAIKEDGTVRGIAEAFPGLFGVGVQTYPSPLEKAVTKAEKLTRRLIADKMPDEGRTQEEIDKDQKLSELRSQSRKGIDVSKTLEMLKAQGQISDRAGKSVLSARGQTRLQEGFKRLGLKEALTVYSTMTPSEQDSVKKILGEKAITVDVLPLEDQADVRKKLGSYGFKPGLQMPKRPTVERPERPNPRVWSHQ